MTTVSVVIPARESQDTIGRTIESLVAQTRPPDEILIVIGRGDHTPQFGTLPAVARFIELDIPEQFVRDAMWKRREGARIATGDILYFTDSKSIAEKTTIELSLKLMAEKGVAVVGGICPSWPDHKSHFMALVHDKGLFTEGSTGALLNSQCIINKKNFGKTENLPVTAGICMTKEVFLAVEADFAVEFSRYAATYDDYVLAWLIANAGYDILVTDEIVVYHKHRLELRHYITQISRSGQSAGYMVHMYPDCPFGKKRLVQVSMVWVAAAIATVITLILLVIHGPVAIPGVLTLGLFGYGILGIANWYKAKHFFGFAIPIVTILLVFTFAWHFTKVTMTKRNNPTFNYSLLQIH